MNITGSEFCLVLFQTLIMVIGAVASTIILGLILGYLERISITNIQRTIGYKGIILTAPGVVIHELSHYIMSKLFGYKILDVKLFRPIEGAKDGVLGYVKSSFNYNNIIQRIGMFFVGFAPIFGGAASIILFLRIFLRESYIYLMASIRQAFETGVLNVNFFKVQYYISRDLVNNLFTKSNITSINFWIFMYLAICISSHIALSKADLRGSIAGILTITTVFFMVNLVSNIVGLRIKNFYSILSVYNTLIITLLNIALLFSIVHVIITTIIRIIIRK